MRPAPSSQLPVLTSGIRFVISVFLIRRVRWDIGVKVRVPAWSLPHRIVNILFFVRHRSQQQQHIQCQCAMGGPIRRGPSPCSHCIARPPNLRQPPKGPIPRESHIKSVVHPFDEPFFTTTNRFVGWGGWRAGPHPPPAVIPPSYTRAIDGRSRSACRLPCVRPAGSSRH